MKAAFVFFGSLVFIAFVYSFPIIIDTDIGQDMDDSWAVALALKNPNFDVKLIVTAAHNPYGRAQILAKYLLSVGRTDVPIGIGIKQDDYVGPLYDWAKDFNLTQYPGVIHYDGIEALNSVISSSTVPISLVEIAPPVNLEALASRYPSIASSPKLKGIYAMSGSIYKCYGGGPGPCREYNCAEDPAATNATYTQKWGLTITPLDTCDDTRVTGELFQMLSKANNSNDIILNVLLQNFCFWSEHGGYQSNCVDYSTTLYDPTALYMSYSFGNFEMQELKLIVTSNGTLLINPDGKNVNVALNWKTNGLANVDKWIAETLVAPKNKI